MSQELSSIKCAKVDRSTKNVIYVLVATLTNGNELEHHYVGKTLAELTEFRKNILHVAAAENGTTSNQSLPDLSVKEKKLFGRPDDKNKQVVDDFCQRVTKLPKNVLRNEEVTKFFTSMSAENEEGAIRLLKDKDFAVSKRSKAVSAPTITPPVAHQFSIAKPNDANIPYEEVSDFSSAPVKIRVGTSDYSEIKYESADLTPDMDNNDDYAECRRTSKAPVQNKPVDGAIPQNSIGDGLYAPVNKPKTPGSNRGPANIEHDDTQGRFAAEVERVLYEDATSIALQLPPPLPKQRLASPSSSNELPIKPSPSGSFPTIAAPLTSIPPMPLFPSPKLTTVDTCTNGSSAGNGESGDIQVVAISDYDSSSDNILSFRKGNLATLLVQSDSNWWCVRLDAVHGWVPAAYWRMLNNGECASLITKGNSPWFVGKLNRLECEALLMEHGKQQHFVVRESDSGRYALSIKYDDRIHHFPIEVTPNKKYNIGKHDFKTVSNVISYYQKNALFHDEEGREVMLGSPLVIIKH